jgi:Methyltransferase domain
MTFQSRMTNLKARFGLRRGVFRDIYKYNLWGNHDSASGHGSTMASTELLRQELPKLVAKFGIRTMLDTGCGDYYWMAGLDLGLDLYIGADIVPELILQNRQRYENNERKFVTLDITRQTLPKVDLILCRHCMIHMPLNEIRCCLNNFKRSGSKFLLATTLPGCTENSDIRIGGFHQINLELPPFSLPRPDARIHDIVVIDGQRHENGWLYLWPLAGIVQT